MSRSLDNTDDPNIDNARQAWGRIHELVRMGGSFSGHERNCAFVNLRDGRFGNVSIASGIDYPDDGRALAAVDWDHDGDVDIWTSNRSAPRLRFLRNEMPRNGHFLNLRIIGDGTTTNRDAIGARVEVILKSASSQSGQKASTSSRTLIKTLRAGEGFLSQNSKWIHVGLGPAKDVEKVIVHWPGGTTEEFDDVEVDSRNSLVQNSTRVTSVTGDPRDIELVAADQVPLAPDSQARIPIINLIEVPPLAYQSFSGKQEIVRPGQGNALLINLWASWCTPCLEELNEFSEARDKIRAAEMEVVALAVDGLGNDQSDPALAEQFVQKIGFPFRAGRASEPLLQLLQTIHDVHITLHQPLPLPSSMLIDSRGCLAAIYIGSVTPYEVLEDLSKSKGARVDRFARSAALTGRILESAATERVFENTEFKRRWRFAELFQRVGLQPAALQQFEGIVRLRPDSEEARLALAISLLRYGRLKESQVQFQEALRINQHSQTAHINLGGINLQQRRLHKAKKHYQAALTKAPKDSEILNNRGYVNMLLGEYDLARDDFQKAIAINSEDVRAHANLAWLLATAADPAHRDGEKAIAVARRACEINSRDITSLNALAAAHAESGNFVEAVRVQEVAKKLAPVRLHAELQTRLDLYKSNRPFRQKTQLLGE